MPLHEFILRLLGITRTIQTWHSALLALDADRRVKLAGYADEIAATFARAALAFATLERIPTDARARRDAVRELGRISGYLDDVVSVLEPSLDGRKLAGFRRRLTGLNVPQSLARCATVRGRPRLDALLDAEGYFRALADGLSA